MDIEITVEKLKREKRDIGLKFNVCEIGLFGSYVKNEQTKKAMLIYWLISQNQ